MHHESIIHSMVEFEDNSIIAQIADYDMRLPISYALFYPERRKSIGNSFDLLRLNNLHFSKIDLDRYPCLAYAIEAYKIGGSMPAVLNAANEAAVKLFLDGKISFLDIEKIIKNEMDSHQALTFPTLEEVYLISNEVKDRIYEKYLRS
jgi:1-deoxy-D-xylulose-5-phosphate reductoisomerase